MRIGLCFYGQVKNVDEFMLQSIQKCVLEPFFRASHTPLNVVYFLHTYYKTTFTNPRNAEHTEPIDVMGSMERMRKKFPFFETSVHDAAAMESHLLPMWNAYLRNGDPWPDNPGRSLMYFLMQLFGLRVVTRLWLHHPDSFDLLIYLRPDMLFTRPLSFQEAARILSRCQEKTIWLPDLFQASSTGKGWNDRFAIGNPTVMRHYGTRLEALQDFVAEGHPPHAERFLRYSLQSHHIKTEKINIIMVRVRATQEIDVRDRSLCPYLQDLLDSSPSKIHLGRPSLSESIRGIGCG